MSEFNFEFGLGRADVSCIFIRLCHVYGGLDQDESYDRNHSSKCRHPNGRGLIYDHRGAFINKPHYLPPNRNKTKHIFVTSFFIITYF